MTAGKCGRWLIPSRDTEFSTRLLPLDGDGEEDLWDPRIEYFKYTIFCTSPRLESMTDDAIDPQTWHDSGQASYEHMRVTDAGPRQVKKIPTRDDSILSSDKLIAYTPYVVCYEDIQSRPVLIWGEGNEWRLEVHTTNQSTRPRTETESPQDYVSKRNEWLNQLPTRTYDIRGESFQEVCDHLQAILNSKTRDMRDQLSGRKQQAEDASYYD